MKAEEVAVQILSALHGGDVNASHASVPLIEPFLRSYGLACAMAERERCAEIIRYSCIDDIEQELRSRPVGDELMKEIEG